MWVTRKPSSSMPLITLAGGGEPPVWMSTTWAKRRRCSAGAEISMLSTVGAPHIWVTPCSAIIGKISAGSNLRRQTWVQTIATNDQVKNQTLQWNNGHVHK